MTTGIHQSFHFFSVEDALGDQLLLLTVRQSDAKLGLPKPDLMLLVDILELVYSDSHPERPGVLLGPCTYRYESHIGEDLWKYHLSLYGKRYAASATLAHILDELVASLVEANNAVSDGREGHSASLSYFSVRNSISGLEPVDGAIPELHQPQDLRFSQMLPLDPQDRLTGPYHF